MLDKLNSKYNLVKMLYIAGWATIICCLVLCILAFFSSWTFIGLLQQGIFGLILLIICFILLVFVALFSGAMFFWAAKMLELSKKHNDISDEISLKLDTIIYNISKKEAN